MSRLTLVAEHAGRFFFVNVDRKHLPIKHEHIVLGLRELDEQVAPFVEEYRVYATLDGIRVLGVYFDQRGQFRSLQQTRQAPDFIESALVLQYHQCDYITRVGGKCIPHWYEPEEESA